ncbi:MAG: pseudouridine synthase [Candidatus Kapaibacteriota bacterium]
MFNKSNKPKNNKSDFGNSGKSTTPKKDFGYSKEKSQRSDSSRKTSPSAPFSKFSNDNSKKDFVPRTLPRKPKPKFIRDLKPTVRNKNLADNEAIRLNKYIADSGLCSRRKADELILEGVVKVNGVTANVLGSKVNPGDKVTVRGNPLPEVIRKVYILFNKPKDVIISVKDERDRTTVMDIVKSSVRIFPVGRLDRNTTGALLLTNDGELAHRLLHPSFQVERTYNALLDKELLPKDAEKISKGVELEDGMTSPCKIYYDPRNHHKVILTLKEGRNHEVKRLFMHFGYNVKQLDRKVFADLSVQNMERGEYRHLTRAEVQHLRKLVGLDY